MATSRSVCNVYCVAHLTGATLVGALGKDCELKTLGLRALCETCPSVCWIEKNNIRLKNNLGIDSNRFPLPDSGMTKMQVWFQQHRQKILTIYIVLASTSKFTGQFEPNDKAIKWRKRRRRCLTLLNRFRDCQQTVGTNSRPLLD